MIRSRSNVTSRTTESFALTAATGLLLTAFVGVAGAQTVEIAPFGGYRFGGDLFEVITETPLDIDGAPVIGATVDVFVGRGLSVTFLYSHQDALIDVPTPQAEPVRVRLAIDHWQVGGTQEVGRRRVRPFYTATLGLTRFGGAGDSETRFSFGGGGGAKLMALPHVGARVDGRFYGVVVEGDTSTGICTPGLCLIGLNVSLIWQAEFTAGVFVSF